MCVCCNSWFLSFGVIFLIGVITVDHLPLANLAVTMVGHSLFPELSCSYTIYPTNVGRQLYVCEKSQYSVILGDFYLLRTGCENKIVCSVCCFQNDFSQNMIYNNVYV